MTIAEVWKVVEAVLLSLGGGSAIVLGFSNWLGKVWANRLMEKERAAHAAELERLRSSLEKSSRFLQGEIEKTIFVSKTHFETEFKALADIWSHIARVRTAMARLRPPHDLLGDGQTKETRLTERFEAFGAAHDPFIMAIDHQSPFYAEDIFRELDGLIRIVKREGLDVESSHDRFTPEWYSRGETNFTDFVAGAEKVSESIRARLSKLSVYGGSFGS